MTFEDSQVNVSNLKDKNENKKQAEERKQKTKNATTNETQEKYEQDKERKQKIPSKKVTYDPLTNDAWNKKRRHKGDRADPFRFDPRYKKRKKPGGKDGTIAVPQQKKKNVDTLIHDAWNKKRKHKRKGADNWLFC